MFLCVFFFFKQKTSYEMRISDWSSDVCSSDLLNIPGEGDSVIATLDGHQLAKRGRGALALGVSALGGFAAATISLIALQLLGPRVAGIAIQFGPRSEERRVGKACVRTCRSRGWP